MEKMDYLPLNYDNNYLILTYFKGYSFEIIYLTNFIPLILLGWLGFIGNENFTFDNVNKFFVYYVFITLILNSLFVLELLLILIIRVFKPNKKILLDKILIITDNIINIILLPNFAYFWFVNKINFINNYLEDYIIYEIVLTSVHLLIIFIIGLYYLFKKFR